MWSSHLRYTKKEGNMPAIDPVELIALTLANTIKMVATPVDYLFQSGTLGDLFYIGWLFIG